MHEIALYLTDLASLMPSVGFKTLRIFHSDVY